MGVNQKVAFVFENSVLKILLLGSKFPFCSHEEVVWVHTKSTTQDPFRWVSSTTKIFPLEPPQMWYLDLCRAVSLLPREKPSGASLKQAFIMLAVMNRLIGVL
jgi:hypothetical protein